MSKGKWVTLQRKKKVDYIFNKLPKRFADFLVRITDKDPQFCFVCGFYIPFSQRDKTKKPNKKSDPCHEDCFNRSVKFANIHGKLNEDSELICWIDKGEPMSKQPICRNRVRNNPDSIAYHIAQKHPDLIEPFSFVEPGMGIEYKEFRKEMFLRPDGRKF